MSHISVVRADGELLVTAPYNWAPSEEDQDEETTPGQHIATLLADVRAHFVVPLSRQDSDPAARFHELADWWRSETTFLSSTTEKAIHPAYQQIIGLGKNALPLILNELQKKEEHWFWALKAITGVDPVAVGDRGRVHAMAEAWLKWGGEQGFL